MKYRNSLPTAVGGNSIPLTATLVITSTVNILVPETPLGIQKEEVKKLKLVDAKTKNLESVYSAKLAALEELKKSILQKAFSGELTKTSDNKTKQGALA